MALDRAAQSVGTILLILLPDGQVVVPMVVAINHWSPKWKFPTGNVEVTEGVSEDIFSAAIREICEETGLVVDLAEIKSPRAISQVIPKENGAHHLHILGCLITRNEKDLQWQLRYEDKHDGKDLLHAKLFKLDVILECVACGVPGQLATRDGTTRHGILPAHIEYFQTFWKSLDMPNR